MPRTTREWMTLPWVHMHGQYTHHSEAHILATKEGLEALRDAIGAALSGGKGEATVYASDGEGYSVHIERVPFSRLGEPPYLDTIARRLMDSEVETIRRFRKHRQES